MKKTNEQWEKERKTFLDWLKRNSQTTITKARQEGHGSVLRKYWHNNLNMARKEAGLPRKMTHNEAVGELLKMYIKGSPEIKKNL